MTTTERPTIQERYSSAVRSKNLVVDALTTFSDTDVLGAMGLAGKENPLAVALQRLFAGDNGAADEVVADLAKMLRGKAPRMQIKITEVQAADMAKACLAWHRDGSCHECGGHGVYVISGTKTLGAQECKACKGEGKRPFDREFHQSFRVLANWLVAEMEREQAKAGPAAMAKIAPKLDF